MNPIDHLATSLIIQGHDQKMVSSLITALRADHQWREIAGDAEHRMRCWETETLGWNIKVFSFYVGNQPNQEAGAEGQLFAATSLTQPLILASMESLLFKQVGAHLFQEINSRSFLGSGSLPTREHVQKMVAKHQFKKGEADLRDPEQLKLVVNWLRDLIASGDKDFCQWKVPRDGKTYMIDKKAKTVRVEVGPMDMPTRISFYALGYKTENDPHDDHDEMMCQLWSTLYEP